MLEITQRIQEEATRLLQDGKVDVVIGYHLGSDEEEVSPCFVIKEPQATNLVFNEHCTHNLAKYLVGREGYLTSHFRPSDELPRVAVVAHPATLRAIAGLIQEHQFKREDLIILGVVDGSQVGVEPDVEVGRIEEDSEERKELLTRIRELEDMSVSERREYWQREFSKCIRCYACRQVCPFCYCEQCIADENQPQWIGKSPSLPNNEMWNLIRAFHLTGRCIACRECDRVCPMQIPLSLLNEKLAAEVLENFGYVAGTDVETAAPLDTYKVDDPDDFIR
ncbi:MAG: 4Fe-4S dicluster domain-containing protein [Anaerolineae bacterium]|nr:4Fe-4S dicluster domain-containing protein [Anaerolineae bacterium]